jgi:hypothetical protein
MFQTLSSGVVNVLVKGHVEIWSIEGDAQTPKFDDGVEVFARWRFVSDSSPYHRINDPSDGPFWISLPL